MNRWKTAVYVVFLLVFAAAARDGRAQTAEAYPSKPIRTVLPQPPGGAVDTISRSLGVRLTELLSQPLLGTL